MKKLLKIAAVVAVLLLFCAIAIASGSSRKEETVTKTQQSEEVENPGEITEAPETEKEVAQAEKAETEKPTRKANPNEIGDYEVIIKSAKVTKDYDGKPALIVNFDFTNNADEAESWMTSLTAKAFQDGVELDTAFISSSNKDYDSSNASKDIKPGATVTIQKAYELDNTSSDVEVEVSEWLSRSGTVLTKTFQIS